MSLKFGKTIRILRLSQNYLVPKKRSVTKCNQALVLSQTQKDFITCSKLITNELWGCQTRSNNV